MSVVPAICPECGKAVKTDDAKKADICKHCGEAFIVAEAIAAAGAAPEPTATVSANKKKSATPPAAKKFDPLSAIPQDEQKFWSIEGTILVKYTGKRRALRIPDGITEIASGAVTVEELTVPPTVKRINKSAVFAKRIIVESNPDIVFAANFCSSDASIELLGAFKKFEGILDHPYLFDQPRPTLLFHGTQKQLLSYQPDLLDHIERFILLFEGEKLYRSKQWDNNAIIVYFTLNKNDEAIILSYKCDTLNLTIVDKDFRKIDGHTVREFRTKHAQKEFFETIRFHSTMCGIKLYPAKCAYLPLGLTYLPKELELNADSILLPATIEVIESKAITGWNHVGFYGGLFDTTNVKRIEENGFCYYNIKGLRYPTVLIKNEPDYIHESVCKFVEYDTFDPIDIGGGLGTVIPVHKYLGKKKKYQIELDAKCGKLKAVATRFNPYKAYTEELYTAGKTYTVEFPADCMVTLFDDKNKIISVISPVPTVNHVKKSLLGYKIEKA